MVHCLAGAHRAGTTGVSYMMRAGNLKYIEARKIAKQRRSVVDPFANLEQLLIRLEKAYLKYDF
jgi:protein-tyrosine phosphatase